MSSILKQVFQDTLFRLGAREPVTRVLWQEVEQLYTATSRHYHTLQHLESMLELLLPFKPTLSNWDEIMVAMYYHDIIYDPLQKSNEERSAAKTTTILRGLGVDETMISNIASFILSTKHHEAIDVAGSDLFLDADLAILGSPSDTYENYRINIRKEYRFFPDLIYKPGRRKVVLRFLEKPAIFKTSELYLRFEQQARQNLAEELKLLR